METKNLIIFAKPPHFYRRGTLTTRRPHLYRTSSLIRGEQIAQYLGCEYNPTERKGNNIAVHVKPSHIEEVRDGDWVDVLDNFQLLRRLKSRPEVGIIFCSQYHYDLFYEQYPKSVMIPHHHCNFDREVRTRKEITTVGHIGSLRGVDIPFEVIEERLAKIGMTFIENHKFSCREDSVAFYKTIDIQLVWKEDGFIEHTPMKVVNAASYGIPSVSKHCENYREIEGFYDAVEPNLDVLFTEIEKLKDPAYYNSWSEKLIPEMERYHISNIAPLYEKLNSIH